MAKEKQEKQKKPLWERVVNLALIAFVVGMFLYVINYTDTEMRSEERAQREAQKNHEEFTESVERGHVYEVVTEGNAILAITINATTYRPNSITIKEYPEYVDQTNIVRNMSPNEVHYRVDNFKNGITVYYIGGMEEFNKKFSKQ